MGFRESLPDFLLIGAMKSGSTTLYADLAGQDSIYIPSRKELNVLADARRKVNQQSAEKQYARYFASVGAGVCKGDCSTNYSKLPLYGGVIELVGAIYEESPKIVYVVRDPIERLLSHLHHVDPHGAKTGRVSLPLLEDEYPEAIAFSKYAMQIEPWIDRFGVEQVCVLSLEHYVRNRMACLEQVMGHLQAPFVPDAVDLGNQANKSQGKLVDGRLTALISNNPFYQRWIAGKVGPDLKMRLRTMLGKQSQAGKPVLEPGVREGLVGIFSQDVKRLQTICPDLIAPWFDDYV